MKRPIEVDAATLVAALEQLGYRSSSQTDGHIRLTSNTPGTVSVTIPNRRALKAHTLEAILRAIAPHHRMDPAELAGRLFD